MSKSRQKGTLAESALVKYLAGHGWPHCSRAPLRGALDTGDVTGTPGIVWEQKNARTYRFPEWLKETEQERENAGAEIGVLVVKPNGVGTSADKVGQWWCVLPLSALTNLLRDAGYGDPR